MQRPLGVIDWIVRSFSLPGQMVLDCFAGSCVTVEAAVRAERNAIGIERDPAFYVAGRGHLVLLGFHLSTLDR